MTSLFPSITRHRVPRRAGLLLASVALAVPTTVVAQALAGSPVASAAETLSQTFTYNDTTQYFTVPAGVGSLDLTASGGQGGSGTFAAAGGDGAQISETVAVTPGDTLVVEVGGAGADAGSFGSGGSGGLSSGDAMNGGAGGATNYLVDGGPGGGGGGGTEVVDATSGRVLVVAAGGGGGGGEDGLSDSDGGVGGTGGTGTVVDDGQDGTSRYGAGGAGGAGGSAAAPAGQNGGTPQQSTSSGGGGGGGGGYYVPSLYGGGGDAGAGGGWSAYQSGGGGGGGGASFAPSFAVNVQPSTSTGNGAVTLTWTAPPTATTTQLAFAPTSAVVGQSYTVSATVAGTGPAAPTGPVQFSSDGTVVGTATLNGGSPDVATWTATAPATPGTVTWQAQYLGDTGAPGDPGDTGSTSTVGTVTVTKATTTTTLSISPDSATVGVATTFTVTVTGSGPVPPTGVVGYFLNGTEQAMAGLSGGTPDRAVFTEAFPTSGDDIATAQYEGDTADDPSTSAPVTEPVAAGPAPTTLAVSPGPVASGKPYTLTATVTGFVVNPTGTVLFQQSTGPATSVALVPQAHGPDSVATLTVRAPDFATDLYWGATYSGDANYASSSSGVVTETVAGSKEPPQVASISPTSGEAGTVVTITGSRLNGATKILFGTKAAKTFNCPSSTSCTAVAPKGVSGKVAVYVTTARGGRSDTNSNAVFTYLAKIP